MSLKLRNFSLAIFEFVLLLKENAYIPQLPSALRGALGQALEETCSKKDTDCNNCPKAECAYGYLFFTPARMGNTSRKYSEICHPFILEPPLTKKSEFEAEQTLKCRLILIGKGISYLPHFVYAFQQGNKIGIGYNRAKYELMEIYSIFGRNRTKIYDSQSKQLTYRILHFPDIMRNSSFQSPVNEISLRFISPTRLKFNNNFVSQSDFQFHVLFRCLLRRISDLSKIHCDEELPEHYGYLFPKAKEVETIGTLFWSDKWEHFAKKKAEKMKLGGLIGHVTFKGQLDEFLPFLKVGQIVHVGGKTVFGCGKYVLG